MNRSLITAATLAPIGIFLAAAAFFSACADPLAPPALDPNATVAITFAASTRIEPPRAPEEAAPPPIEITRLQLQIERIELRPENEDGQPGRGMARVQAFEDLFVDALDPSASELGVDAEPGLYRRVDLSVGRTAGDSGLDGTDASLWVEGQKDATRFRFLAENLDRLSFRDVDLAVDDQGVATLAVDLDVESWFDDVDMAALSVGPRGIARIAAVGPNRQIWRQIVRGINQRVRARRGPRRGR